MKAIVLMFGHYLTKDSLKLSLVALDMLLSKVDNFLNIFVVNF